jgi:hypothetical protein
MRNHLLSFFLLLGSFNLVAQAPQAICYQGVAVSATGNELINQAIGLRLSVLSGSVSGTPVFVETHGITTDEFGLFNVDIGTGSPVISTIGAINWGAGPYFLKVEMDATGGQIFQLIGITQLVSVPYALYADKSNVSGFADSTAVAHTSTSSHYADTAFVAYYTIGNNDTSATNEIQTILFNEEEGTISLSATTDTIHLFSGAFNAPGASLDYPLGLRGTHVLIGGGDYEIPAGKTFFMTGGKEQFSIKTGTTYVNHERFPAFPTFPSATIIKDCYCSGLLTDNSPDIESVIVNFANFTSGYTVPAGKSFVLKSGANVLFVTNIALGFNNTIFTPYQNSAYSGSMIFPEGTTLLPFGVNQVILTGYLMETP